MQLLISGDALVDKDIPLHWLETTAKTAVQLMRKFTSANRQVILKCSVECVVFYGGEIVKANANTPN